MSDSSDAEMDGGPRVKFAPPEVITDDGLAYDPDQDPEEKRRLRKSYRDLNKYTEGKMNPNEFTAHQLSEKVHQADELFKHVKGPQEATLDSAFLLMASNMGAMKARAMKSGPSAFDADDFVAKLITFMGGRRQAFREDAKEDIDSEFMEDEDEGALLDWDKIGRKALAKSRRVPVIDFMLGPLSIEAKKRAQTKRARLEKNEKDRTKPQEINEEDITRSENETSTIVARVNMLLEECGTINLFKFIINPNDFGQSVENMFYLSFLIRDGKCALETNEEGEPMIYACEEPTDADRGEGLKRNQIVMEFDMPTWERAIEVFEITEPIIPQRVVKGTRIGSKWYG